MKTYLKRFWALFITVMMLINMLPIEQIAQAVDMDNIQIHEGDPNGRWLGEALRNTGTTDLTVEKVWINTDPKERKDVEIRVKINYGSTGSTSTNYEIFKGFKGEGQAALSYDHNGNLYYGNVTDAQTKQIPLLVDGAPISSIQFDYEKGTAELLGYTVDDTTNTVTVYNTVTKKPEVTKKWPEGGDATINTISVVATCDQTGATYTATVSKNANGEWVQSNFDTPLPMGGKTANGDFVAYTYTVRETAINGDASLIDNYETTISGDPHKGYVIENNPKVAQDKVVVRVAKQWQATAGSTGGSATFEVRCLNDASFEPITLPAFNQTANGVTTIQATEELDKYVTGTTDVPRKYVVVEIDANGNFKTVANGMIEEDGRMTYSFTNVAQEKTNLSATKVWKDNHYADRFNATIYLLRNGQRIPNPDKPGEYIKVTAMANYDGTYDFGAYDKYDENGVAYVYSLEEVLPEGSKYTPIYDNAAMTVYNYHEDYTPGAGEKPRLSITKIWDPNGYQYTIFPEVVFNIYDVTGGIRQFLKQVTMPASSAMAQTLAINDLELDPTRKYEIVEANTNAKWDVEYGELVWYAGNAAAYFSVTNKLNDHLIDLTETEDIYITKTWDVADDVDISALIALFDVTASSIDAQIQQTGGSNGASYSAGIATIRGNGHIVLKVKKYDHNGNLITYYVNEQAIPGFTMTYEHLQNLYAFTNTQKKTQIAVHKTWSGLSNRPTSLTALDIKYDLLRKVKGADDGTYEQIDSVTLSAADFTGNGDTRSGVYLFSKQYPLSERGANGQTIEYEYFVKETILSRDAEMFVQSGGAVISGRATLNNQYDKILETTTYKVEKHWSGPNADEEYPESVIQLYADGVALPGKTWTVAKGKTDILINTFTDLPKYRMDENGAYVLIVYTVEEISINGEKISLGDKVAGAYDSYVDGKTGISYLKPLREYKYANKSSDVNDMKENSSDVALFNEVIVPDYAELNTLVLSKVWYDKDRNKVVGDALNTDFYNTTPVYFQVSRKLKNGTEEEIVYPSIMVNAQMGWVVELENVPACDVNGVEYTYIAREINPPAGYVAAVEDYFIWKRSVEGGRLDIGVASLNNVPTEAKATVTFNKLWEKGEFKGELDALIPQSIKIRVKSQTSSSEYTIELTRDGGWTAQQELPTYEWYRENKDAQWEYRPIAYTIIEIDGGKDFNLTNIEPGATLTLTDGVFTINGATGELTLTNTVDEKITIRGKKVWDDFGNKFNQRPSTLAVALERKTDDTEWVLVNNYTLGSDLGYTTASGSNYWTFCVSELDKFSSTGARYQYRWVETTIPQNYKGMTTEAQGYEGENDGVIKDSVLLNEYDSRDVLVTKTWQDPPNMEGVTADIYPASITIDLYCFSDKTYDPSFVGTYQITAQTNWEVLIENLPKYDELGNAYSYYATERTSQQFLCIQNGYRYQPYLDLINRIETRNVAITKSWQGDDPSYRPESLTVTLTGKADGRVVVTREIVLTAEGDWKGEFTRLPKFCTSNGKQVEIAYSVSEENLGSYVMDNGYGSKITGVSVPYDGNTTIINKLETTSAKIYKSWENDTLYDTNDGAGTYARPTSLTFKVYRTSVNFEESFYKDATITPGGWWNGQELTVNDLPKYDIFGDPYTYRLEEDMSLLSPAYTESYTTNANGTLNVTNTYNPVNVKVTKVFENDANITRPSKLKIILTGKTQSGYERIHEKTMTVSSTNAVNTITFEKLPRYAIYNGTVELIDYTITEAYLNGEPVTGYRITTIGPDSSSTAAQIEGVITNTYVPTTVNVEKQWETVALSDGVNTELYNGRPDSIMLTLRRKTGTDNIDSQFSRPFELSKAAQQQASFDNLPAADADGNAYTYFFEENVSGYHFKEISKTYDENTKTYAYTLNNKPILGAVKGTKAWTDGDNQYGTRPATVTLTLVGTANGKQVYSKTAPDFDIETNPNFAFNFDKLPLYHYEGTTAYPISYTLTENGSAAYRVLIDGQEGTSVVPKINGEDTTLENALLTTAVYGQKTWEDYGEENVRPSKVTIKLMRQKGNGTPEEVDSRVITSQDGAEYSFTGLPQKAPDGENYTYTVEEETLLGYTPESTGNNIENTLNTVTFKVTKEWLNVDGVTLPDVNITLTGTATGSKGTAYNKTHPHTMSAENTNNTWEYTYTGLPRYAYLDNAFVLIEYNLTEGSISGYELIGIEQNNEVSATAAYDATITNKREAGSITVKKVWADDSHVASQMRQEIEITLNQYLGDTFVKKVGSIKLDGTNPDGTKIDGSEWSHTFTDLTMFDPITGAAYTFKVEETQTAHGYAVSYDQDTFKVTNTLVTLDIPVTKQWVGDQDVNALRPETISVILKRSVDGIHFEQVGEAVEIDISESTDSYSYTFPKLPKYNKDGLEYTYVVDETDVPGYAKQVEGYAITNTMEAVSLTIYKDWLNDDTTTRPDAISVRVIGTGSDEIEYYNQLHTISKPANDYGRSWSLHITGLPKLDSQGNAITYQVTESTVDNYTSQKGEVIKQGDSFFVTITNTLKTEDKTTVQGVKTWIDEGNAFLTRPESIVVTLYKEGSDDPIATQTVFAPWTYAFTDLDTQGEYYVTEAAVAGYTVDEVIDMNLTNTLLTTALTGHKTWVLNGNTDYQPTSAVFTCEYSDDFGDTWNPVIKNKKQWTAQANASNDWTYTFSGLPTQMDGKDVSYRAVEKTVPGFATEQADNDFTNTLEVIDLTVNKQWLNDKAAYRPNGLDITLTSSDNKITEETTLSGDTWSYTFTNLPKYEFGKTTPMTYTVKETPVANYDATKGVVTVKASADETSLTATLINTLKTTQITAEKRWIDDDNLYGTRPDSVTYKLKQNGVVINTGIGAKNEQYKYTFSDLPACDASGIAYTYTIDEENVSGYNKSVSGLTVTNTLESVSISGQKTWVDADGYIPDTLVVTVEYSLDGGTTYQPLVKSGTALNKTLTNEDRAYTFDGLPKVINGLAATYRVVEESLNGFTMTRGDGYALVNTLVTAKLKVKKDWLDDANNTQMRPASLDVILSSNDPAFTARTITLDTDNGWTVTEEKLPLYIKGTTVLATYTVTEQKVNGYDIVVGSASTALSITQERTLVLSNRLKTISIPVVKMWEDNGNAGETRPASVRYMLYRDDEAEPYQTADALAATNYAHVFTDLPYENNETGVVYTYTVKEERVAGYQAPVISDANGVVLVTNTLDTEPTDMAVTVNKLWLGEGTHGSAERPDAITVTLTSKTDSDFQAQNAQLNAQNGWTHTFTGLPFGTYEVTEGDVTGYVKTVGEGTVTYEDGTAHYTITLKNTLEVKDITVEKEWSGDSENIEARPESLTYILYRDGKAVAVGIAEKTDHYAYTFTGLAKYAKATGKDYVYTVSELPIAGYEAKQTETETGVKFTNTYNPVIPEPETMSLHVVKVWNDQNDLYGLRPATVSYQLMRNDVAVGEAVAVSFDHTFTDLPIKDEQGNAYTYTVLELPVAGYREAEISRVSNVVTVKNNLLTTDIPVTKSWAAGDDLTSRPTVVEVTITGKVGDTEVLTRSAYLVASSGWTYTFTNLPQYATIENAVGKITYTVSETVPNGYSANVNGFDIENTLIPTTVKVIKNWVPNNATPENVTVQLYRTAEGKREAVGTSRTLSAANNWQYTYEGLAKYNANGAEYAFEAVELGGSKAYALTIAQTNAPGEKTQITLTNTLLLTSLSGKKVWANDAAVAAAMRPEAITIVLVREGVDTDQTCLISKDDTVTEQAWSFDNLQKYDDNGNAYRYTVREQSVPAGYEATTRVNDNGEIILTNTLNTLSLTVNKFWEGDTQADRPERLAITVIGTGKNGVVYYANNAIELTAPDWQATVTDLPRYGADGQLIDYMVTEGVLANYNLINTVNPVSDATALMYFARLTNSFGKTGISGQKTWVDQNNAYLTRPTAIQIQLWRKAEGVPAETVGEVKNVTAADGWAWHFGEQPLYVPGTETPYEYYVEEVNPPIAYQAAAAGMNVTNTLKLTSIAGEKEWITYDHDGYLPQSLTVELKYSTDGENWVNVMHNGGIVVKVLTSANNWRWSFGELPEYLGDEKVTYKVFEQPVSGFIADEKAADKIINTLSTINVKVVKDWQDGDLTTLRPEGLTVTLSSSDTTLAPLTETLTPGNGWEATFANLPKYIKGTTIPATYTVREQTPVAGYDATIASASVIVTDAADYVLSLQNTLKAKSLTVNKTWVDANNAQRPESVSVTLKQNGLDYGEAVTLDAQNNWTHTFSDLPVEDAQGIAYAYTIAEQAVPGYTATINPTHNGFSIVNTLDTVSIVIEKQWSGDAKDMSLRGTSLDVLLKSSDGAFADLPVTLLAVNGWQARIDGLPMYEAGTNTPVTYTVEEVNAPKGYILKNAKNPNVTVNVTENVYFLILENALDTMSLNVVKVWDDFDNANDTRPANVTYILYRNGSLYATATVTDSENKSDYNHTFEGLPIRDADGNAFEYVLDEIRVDGYEKPAIVANADGKYKVTNKLDETKTDKMDLYAMKKWVDVNDAQGLRPGSITYYLYRDDILVDTVIADAEDNYAHIFKDLEVTNTAEDRPYSYNIVEAAVPGYTSAVTASNGVYLFTNTLDTVSLTIYKDFLNEGKHLASQRPDGIALTLTSSNPAFVSGPLELNAANRWQLTLSDLPRYNQDGTLATYTVTEDAGAGNYQAAALTMQVQMESGKNTYAVTFENELLLTQITAQKIWDDDNNAKKLRPDTIEYILKRNGTELERVKAYKDNDYAYTFTQLLQKDKDGKDYLYTLDETPVSGYMAPVVDNRTYTVTNRMDLIDVEVTKVWKGESSYGTSQRPAGVEYILYRDGVEIRREQAVKEEGYAYTFKDLLKTDKLTGLAYDYTVAETQALGYLPPDVKRQGNAFEVTNTLDSFDITVTKAWLDEIAGDTSARPESITVEVTSSDPVFKKQTLVLTADDWRATLSGLPKYIKGTSSFAEYTLREVAVNGYTPVMESIKVQANASAASAVVAFENKFTSVDVFVQKIWDDQNNQFDTRPESISVDLMRDGKKLTDITLPINGAWEYTFNSLPACSKADGHLYTYTVSETKANGYLAPEIAETADGFTITNKLETVDLSGKKKWDDKSNAYRTRPASIQVSLIRSVDGNHWEYAANVDTLTVTDPWTWRFTGMPARDKQDKIYRYAVTEQPDARYSATYTLGNMMDLTNTLKTIMLRVEKVWQDEGNKGMRPTSLNIKLQGSDGKTYNGTLIDRAGKWYAEYRLPMYDAQGQRITYTLSETVPNGYKLSSVSDWVRNEDAQEEAYTAVITNTSETTSVTVKKTWVGASLSSITVKLMDGQTQIGKEVVVQSPWTYTWSNLPKYHKDGTLINYTVVETPIAQFTTTYSTLTNKNEKTVTIVNTYTPEPTPTSTPTLTPPPGGHTVPVPTPTPILPPGLPEVTPTPAPSFPPDADIVITYTIEDENIPLGAGINLNLGDCFD